MMELKMIGGAPNIWKYNISAEDAGTSVKDILRQKLHLSQRRIAALKQQEKGLQIEEYVEGVTRIQEVTVRYVTREGQSLCILLDDIKAAPKKIVLSDFPIDILYEDASFLFLNKAPNIVTHPSVGHQQDSLCNGAANYLAQTQPKAGIHVLGRLDKETSGLVSIAKNSIVSECMRYARQEKECYKEYIALVKGSLDKKSGVISLCLLADNTENGALKMRVDGMGKEAVTFYEVEEEYETFSKVRVRLQTGRTHQIRCHFAAIGHPLLGDTLYGEGRYYNLERAALHAEIFEMIHPVTRKRIRIEAPIPRDMQDILLGMSH